MSARPVRSVLLLCWRDTGHPQGGGSETYLQRIGAQLAASGVRSRCAPRAIPVRRGARWSTACAISRGGGRYSVYIWAGLAMVAARIGLGPLRRVRPDVVIDTQNGLPFMARLAFGRRVAVLVHHCHREQWPVAGPADGPGRLVRRVEAVAAAAPTQPVRHGVAAVGAGPDGLWAWTPSHIAVVRNGLDEAPPRNADRAAVGDPAGGGAVTAGAAQADRGRAGRGRRAATADARTCIWTSSAAAGGSSGWSTTPRCWASPTR